MILSDRVKDKLGYDGDMPTNRERLHQIIRFKYNLGL